MENFIFQNPVKLIMGHGMIARLSKEIPSDKRIMITFGGGSVKKNGVYDQVKEALKDHFTVEFWGIEPNPAIETLRKAIALGKEQKVDYLLAVGGGSVIDGTKLISAGLLYDGDAWDLVLAGRPATKTVPLSTVLTLPATGSEMNNGAVISRRETKDQPLDHVPRHILCQRRPDGRPILKNDPVTADPQQLHTVFRDILLLVP